MKTDTKSDGERELARTLEKELTREEKHLERLKSPQGTVKGKAFYVTKAPHYRDGVLYPTGSTVCVEDEKPSKTWRRIKPVKGAAVLKRPAVPEEVVEDYENEDIVPLVVDTAKPNPGGVAPSLTQPASTAVTVPTTPDEVKAAKDEKRPHDRKL